MRRGSERDSVLLVRAGVSVLRHTTQFVDTPVSVLYGGEVNTRYVFVFASLYFPLMLGLVARLQEIFEPRNTIYSL